MPSLQRARANSWMVGSTGCASRPNTQFHSHAEPALNLVSESSCAAEERHLVVHWQDSVSTREVRLQCRQATQSLIKLLQQGQTISGVVETIRLCHASQLVHQLPHVKIGSARSS